MTKHWPVYDGHYATHCECGWGEGVSFGRFQDDEDTQRHVESENVKAKMRETAEAERIRLLSECQNWDMA